jgi:hypothetical protein
VLLAEEQMTVWTDPAMTPISTRLSVNFSQNPDPIAHVARTPESDTVSDDETQPSDQGEQSGLEVA